METKLNLYQKLLVIQKHILGLGKNKKSFGYDYVNSDKVLGEIKPLMNELGLLLKQEIISIDNQRTDYTVKSGSKSEMFTKVMMQFTWIDVESGEKDVNSFGANGQNDWEKGLGSALTYGERYFLLKYFHIATDCDDIDNPDRKTSAPIPVKQPTLAAKIEDAKALLLQATKENLGSLWKTLSVEMQSNEDVRKLLSDLIIKLGIETTKK